MEVKGSQVFMCAGNSVGSAQNISITYYTVFKVHFIHLIRYRTNKQ